MERDDVLVSLLQNRVCVIKMVTLLLLHQQRARPNKRPKGFLTSLSSSQLSTVAFSFKEAQLNAVL